MYPDLVAEGEYLTPPKHSYVHEIPTTGTLPSSKPRRLSPKMYELCKEKFNQMLKSGLISPSKSPNASAIHIVPKQNDIRICGDFRELNRHIPHDSYPISFMSDFICELYGKRIFSSLDLKEAYHNIPIKNSDKHKTTITSPLGAFYYNRLCFGLSNASQSFQRFMNSALRDISYIDDHGTKKKVTVFCYVDDIICGSENEKTHEKDLEALFKRLDEYGLKLSTAQMQLLYQ